MGVIKVADSIVLVEDTNTVGSVRVATSTLDGDKCTVLCGCQKISFTALNLAIIELVCSSVALITNCVSATGTLDLGILCHGCGGREKTA